MAVDRNILLLGASGQVGCELAIALAPLGRVTALDRGAADLSRPDTLPAIVAAHHADTVVIAAAYTAVDRAESEPQLARTVNAVAPGVIAAAAAAQGASVVYYSTDYVFDGTKADAYDESDPTLPLSVYGATKLEGERAVASAAPRHLIFRTSWVFSAHGVNFVKTVLRLAAQQASLRIVADQTGAPTSAALVAQTTASVLAQMTGAAADDPRWGTYHLTAAGSVTWNAYARYVLTHAHGAGAPLRAGPADVEAITTAQYPVAARRPANSRLNTKRIVTTFGVTLPDWTVGVDAVLTQLSRT